MYLLIVRDKRYFYCNIYGEYAGIFIRLIFRRQNDDKQNSVYVNVRNNFILRINETADESSLHFQFIHTRLQYAHYVVCYFYIFVSVTEEIEPR